MAVEGMCAFCKKFCSRENDGEGCRETIAWRMGFDKAQQSLAAWVLGKLDGAGSASLTNQLKRLSKTTQDPEPKPRAADGHPQMAWKYCECGCKGSELTVGRRHFWYHDNLQGQIHLFDGHGFVGRKIGTFSSYPEMEKACEPLILEELGLLQDAYKKVQDLVATIKVPGR